MKYSTDTGIRKTRILSSDFEGFASDLAMAVWNKLSHLQRLQELHPKDYPEIYEAVYHTLQLYHVRTRQTAHLR